MNKPLTAILLAGGRGMRMKSSVPKQFLKIEKKPIVIYALETLKSVPAISSIIIVCEPTYRTLFPRSDKIQFADPGLERQDSVYNASLLLPEEDAFALIHDGARPLVQRKDIEKLLEQRHHFQAATLAFPVKYTIKEADQEGRVQKTLNRDALWEIQTPQLIATSLLKAGLKKVRKDQITVTDDVLLAELLGFSVKLVKGSSNNLKITHPEDLSLVKQFLQNETMHL